MSDHLSASAFWMSGHLCVSAFSLSSSTYTLCILSSEPFLDMIVTLFFLFSDFSSESLYISEGKRVFYSHSAYCTMPKSVTSDCHSNCLCLSFEIKLQNFSSEFQCNHCFFNLISCIVMKDHKRCAECTHHDKSCVDLSWESLDHVCAKIQSDIEEMEQEQFHHLTEMNCLTSKLACLWKIFWQTQDCAKQKTLCLTQKLTDDNDGTENEDSQTLSQFLNQMSNDLWQSVSSSSQTAAASLCSSWGFVLVPKLTQRYCILFTWQDSELSH